MDIRSGFRALALIRGGCASFPSTSVRISIVDAAEVEVRIGGLSKFTRIQTLCDYKLDLQANNVDRIKE